MCQTWSNYVTAPKLFGFIPVTDGSWSTSLSWKSPCLMGKSASSYTCSIAMWNYQMVAINTDSHWEVMSGPVTTTCQSHRITWLVAHSTVGPTISPTPPFLQRVSNKSGPIIQLHPTSHMKKNVLEVVKWYVTINRHMWNVMSSLKLPMFTFWLTNIVVEYRRCSRMSQVNPL